MAETEHEDWQRNKTALESLSYILENQVACDVQFKAGFDDCHTEVIGAHKTILLSRSPVFYKMFCGELKEIDGTVRVTDVDPEIFRDILKYVYCDEVNLNPENATGLLYASEKYMLDGLKAACWAWLGEHITDETASTIWDCTVLYKNASLEKRVEDHILKNAKDVLKTASFTRLPQQLLRKLLLCSDYHVDIMEEEVFQACLEWGRRQCTDMGKEATGSEIRHVLGECLKLVRFPLMKGPTFVQLMESCPGVLTTEERLALSHFFITGDAKYIRDFTAQARINPSFDSAEVTELLQSLQRVSCSSK